MNPKLNVEKRFNTEGLRDCCANPFAAFEQKIAAKSPNKS